MEAFLSAIAAKRTGGVDILCHAQINISDFVPRRLPAFALIEQESQSRGVPWPHHDKPGASGSP
jgi:hypothetical protein